MIYINSTKRASSLGLRTLVSTYLIKHVTFVISEASSVKLTDQMQNYNFTIVIAELSHVYIDDVKLDVV